MPVTVCVILARVLHGVEDRGFVKPWVRMSAKAGEVIYLIRTNVKEN
jgi:hypothetical protein